MQQAFDNVKALLDEMSFLLIEAGVPARQVKMPEGRPPDQIKIEKYTEAFDWLHRLSQSDAMTAVQKAKALLPQEIWDNYKSFDINGLREQGILADAQLLLRKEWKKQRPYFFGRVYAAESEQDGDQQDTGDGELRPEGERPDEGDC